MEIKRTNWDELPNLNQLISRSKSFWAYDPDYLEAAIPLIQITDIWLKQHEGYTLFDKDGICGFLGIEISVDYWKLEHLWIDPRKIGQGFGKKAIGYLLEIAKNRNAQSIYLLPDPPAENFYLKLGARLTGKSVPSRIAKGPIFREMAFKNITGT